MQATSIALRVLKHVRWRIICQ